MRIIGGTIAPVADASKGYWPALDGIRAISVIGVIAGHAGISFARAGGFGVQIFFVLSGFLITTLLLEESIRVGAIDLGGFYLRRALRLFPALAVLLIFCAILALSLGATDRQQTMVAIPFTILYSSNWYQALAHPPPGGLLSHTWSLAVEEQFYLLWPVILIGTVAIWRSARAVFVVALAGAALSTAWATVLYSNGHDVARVYYGTDTAATPLMLGCAAAAAFNGIRWTARRRGWARWIGAFGFLLMLLGLGRVFRAGLALSGVDAVLELGTAVAILSLLSSPVRAIELALATPVLVWIGRISYGMYLWHAPVIRLLEQWGLHTWLLFAIGLAVTTTISAASFVLIEQRFLKLKKRIRWRDVAPRPQQRVLQGSGSGSG